MTLHILERQQRVEAPLDAVFSFFQAPENLERITPPEMRMQILTPGPITMRRGALIDYVVTVTGLPLRWTTFIDDYDPPHRFVDVQLKGPYSLWHHTHTFEADGDATIVRDVIRYAMPFGPLGALAHGLFVKRQLHAIFHFRRQFLAAKTDWP